MANVKRENNILIKIICEANFENKPSVLSWSNMERFKILSCLWVRNSGCCIALKIFRAQVEHWSWIPWPVKLLLYMCVCVFCRWLPSLFIIAVPNISQKYLHKSLCYVSRLEYGPVLHIWRTVTPYQSGYLLHYTHWTKYRVWTEIEWFIKTLIIHLGGMFWVSLKPKRTGENKWKHYPFRYWLEPSITECCAGQPERFWEEHRTWHFHYHVACSNVWYRWSVFYKQPPKRACQIWNSWKTSL